MNIIQTMNVRMAYKEASFGLADLPAWLARVSRALTLEISEVDNWSVKLYGKVLDGI